MSLSKLTRLAALLVGGCLLLSTSKAGAAHPSGASHPTPRSSPARVAPSQASPSLSFPQQLRLWNKQPQQPRLRYVPPPQAPIPSPAPFRYGYFGVQHYPTPSAWRQNFNGEWVSWNYYR